MWDFLCSLLTKNTESAFTGSETPTVLEGAAGSEDALSQSQTTATAITAPYNIYLLLKTDSQAAIDKVCLITTMERSRIIFYPSITLAVISGQGKTFQSTQFLRTEHERATPVFSRSNGSKQIRTFIVFRSIKLKTGYKRGQQTIHVLTYCMFNTVQVQLLKSDSILAIYQTLAFQNDKEADSSA